MMQSTRSIKINATPEEVWAVLGRYMHIYEFAPLVVATDALTEGEDGVGSKRRNKFENGTSLVEEVTRWEPNQRQTIVASELDAFPLREAIADITIVDLKDGRSSVTWILNYSVKYGPFGWLLGNTLMKLGLGKVLDGNLRGLSERVEYIKP